MGLHEGSKTRPKKVCRVEESAAREEIAKHRIVGDNPKKFPNFFQIYLSEFSSERMPVPRAFVSCLKGMIPKVTVLRNSLGQCWDVEVEKTEEGVFFQHGWKPFYRANSIINGEFLVFHYNGSVFDCSMYGHNMCEKTIPVAVKEEDEDVDSDDPDDGGSGDETTRFQVHVPSDEAREEQDEEDDDSDDHDGAHAGEESDDEDEEMEEEYEDDDPDDDDGEAEEEADGEDEDGSNHLSPKNLSFKALPATNRNKVRAPIALIKDNNIELAETMFFQDPHGRRWKGKVSLWATGAIWIGGWKDFCKKNNVKQGDECICEFVPDIKEHRCTGHNCFHRCKTIKVRIIRKVD